MRFFIGIAFYYSFSLLIFLPLVLTAFGLGFMLESAIFQNFRKNFHNCQISRKLSMIFLQKFLFRSLACAQANVPIQVYLGSCLLLMSIHRFFKNLQPRKLYEFPTRKCAVFFQQLTIRSPALIILLYRAEMKLKILYTFS